ncbi:UbiH/UbiF family hydroxylase [Meridianimarinicoccus sp. RP-17]|uniref:UbiH/UbiF family hydroxylase n=1 Tax=Meridianimarinicoccus zhengii TaxID=2056810 RepID=UPI000DAF09C3|nr:UbiH/UbiF family hydroxylase [Phycocomes zhengii]
MNSTVWDVDVLVAGGGPAGLVAAAAFGHRGFRSLVVDPRPAVTDADDPDADLRTTALLQPSRRFLDEIGLWERLAQHATPLATMRIVDAGGAHPAPRVSRDFEADDIGPLPFGWNLPNWLLRREFVAALAGNDAVAYRPGTGVAGVLTRSGAALVTLDDGSTLRARLVVAADGRHSPLRQAAGIGVRTLRYGQKALAFAVTHDAPHDNISTEIHRSGGPFTLVPLPDRDGRPCSAVVWMERGPEAQRLMALDPAAFSAAATARSGAIYGPLTLTGRRSIWPIISQIADRFHAERTALVAEAAHVVPPIGAQGMNMSLADIRCLVDLAVKADDPGAPEVLTAYGRARRPDVALRVTGIDMLNRTSMAALRPIRDLRGAGIAALHEIAPLRRTLMQLGLGARS